MLDRYLSVLKEAAQQAPITRYAWGLVGFAAAAAAIVYLIGYSRAAIIVIALVLLGTVLVFVLSQLITFGNASAVLVGVVLMWSLVAFFITFLVFTVSAFAAGQPCRWADFLGISSACSSSGTIDGGALNGHQVDSGASSRRSLVQAAVSGKEISVYAGGRSEPNPGCPNRSANACVAPQRGGKLVLGTQQFVVTRRVGEKDRANYTELPGATENQICYQVDVTTGACEEEHRLEGYASAIEAYPVAP